MEKGQPRRTEGALHHKCTERHEEGKEERAEDGGGEAWRGHNTQTGGAARPDHASLQDSPTKE
eukprot:4424987-Pyramimonas_sp.AAC.1